jgi:hypothetical protein
VKITRKEHPGFYVLVGKDVTTLLEKFITCVIDVTSHIMGKNFAISPGAFLIMLKTMSLKISKSGL